MSQFADGDLHGTPLGRWLTLPMSLFLLAWLSINAGPWNFPEFGSSSAQTMNATRAAFPLVVFAIGILGLIGGYSRPRSWAADGFWVYGIVALMACSGAEAWFDQAYWGFAFLGVLAAMELALRSNDRLGALERTNLLSWAITTAVLVALIYQGSDVLLAPNGGDSAYGFINRFQRINGFAVSRETGLSRMAAVPAIISLVYLLSGRGWQRLLSIPVFLASVYVIWIMQSRGALFSFVGSFLFVLGIGHTRGRGTILLFSGMLVAVLLWTIVSQDDLSNLWMHATRDTGSRGFVTQSGRFDIWADLMSEWMKSPLFGYGPQADRLFHSNASNAVIYALICGGLIGVSFFVVAILSAWRALIILTTRVSRLSGHERRIFQITGALLVFYTLRSIPENNAAVFSIDMLLQYPAMIYVVELANSIKKKV